MAAEDMKASYLNRLVLKLDKPPVPLLREVLAFQPPLNNRAVALHRMMKSGDPSTLEDAARELSSSDPQTFNNALALFAAVGPKNVPKALEILEKRILPSAESGVGEALSAAVSLPAAAVVPLIERLWKDATPERRTTLTNVLLRYPADAPHPKTVEFLAKHFDEIANADQRGETIYRFSQAIYEPAMDVIGAALRDPAPSVRSQARAALDSFRKQREALEEFQRWKTGDAEGRASYSELVKLLESPNMQVVAGAVRSLGAIKAKGALPAIVKVLERPGVTPDLQAAVDEAIKKIGE
jgi:HEAT repeat protein